MGCLWCLCYDSDHFVKWYNMFILTWIKWFWFIWISFVCYSLAPWAFHLSGCVWVSETTFRRVSNPRSFGQLSLRFWLVGQPWRFAEGFGWGYHRFAHVFVFWAVSLKNSFNFQKKRVFKYSSIVVHQFGVATVKLSLYAMWVFLSFMVSLAGAGFTRFFEWMIFTKNLSGRCIFRTEVVINWIWSSGNPCRRHGNGNPWKWKLKMKVGFFQGL